MTSSSSLPKQATERILNFLRQPPLNNINDDGDDGEIAKILNDQEGKPPRSISPPREKENSDKSENDCFLTPMNNKKWPPSVPYLLLGDSSSSSPSFDIFDHAYGKKFHTNLKHELIKSKYLEQLKPAKTAMTQKINSVFPLENASSGNNYDRRDSYRGDFSTFVPRSVHKAVSFQRKQPYLHTLIKSIEEEALRCFSSSDRKKRGQRYIKFDRSRTSVQIAQYPGGGNSGYVRHCDVGANCGFEDEAVDGNGKPHNRIITAIYYLNEEDWCGDSDGGCLRVYYPPRKRRIRNGDPEHANEDEEEEQHYDIEPICDRLVLLRSDLVEHEVLPCVRPRLAITVWLYGCVVTPKRMDVSLEDGSNFSSSSPVSKPTEPISESSGIDRTLPNSNHHPPPLQVEEQSKKDHNDKCIFVSIASYRDSETLPTIIDLVQKASNPNRVFVGVVLQVANTSENALFPYAFHNNDDTATTQDTSTPSSPSSLPHTWAKSNLRILTTHHTHSTGPCWARATCQTLWRGEEYTLQIDSHMRFRSDWDTYLIQQLHKCPNPNKSFLTTYPIGYLLPNHIPDDTRPTLLVPSNFDESGILRQKSRLFLESHTKPLQQQHNNNINNNNNIPSPLWAAGFNFGCSTVITTVPYDPFMFHLFFGEEISMAVRLYTFGYDFYAPPTAVCYHLWSRGHRPTFQKEVIIDEDMEKERIRKKEYSMGVVRAQLEGTGRGLGDVRTVKEFAELVGVDFIKKIIFPGAENAMLDASVFATSLPLTSNENDKKEKEEEDPNADVRKLMLDFLGV